MASPAQRSRLDSFFIRLNRALRGRSDAYLARRPHRSFRRTYRRDYVRSFELPGYIGLTRTVFGLLGRDWKLFGGFFGLSAVASLVLLGIASQSNYSTVVSGLKAADPVVWTRTLAIFGAALSGSLNPTASANSGLIASLLVVLGWLVMVWLLRHRVGGKKVSLRDGLYQAGAPLISTILVTLVGLVQCIPLVLVAVGYNAAVSTGLTSNGIEAMLFYGAATLMVLLSLYWLTSTFIALIVVTLPGVHPFAALKASGDLVIGRRFRLILRLLWLGLVMLVVWAVVLIPAIMLSDVINLAWLPIVPLSVLLLSNATLVIASTYIYLLYRRLVDDEAKPA
jgi:hypothetical protein